ncbi:hypothetical protein D6764_04825 [Candidatus Woesearchaeota archaeon]|nr:MAG: hypothetical protein D6764_04825 [Candidatus Woesearchaeota archaeon]
MMDDGFFSSAIWFLAGFFVVPWILRYLLGYVTPFIGLSGAMLIYTILGIQAVLAMVGFKWHSGLALGLALATVKDIISMFYPLPF